MAPDHSSVRTILGSTDMEILKITDQVYLGKSVVAPQCAPPPMTGGVNKRIMPGTGP